MEQKKNQKRVVSTKAWRKRRQVMFRAHPALHTISAEGPGPGTGTTVMNKAWQGTWVDSGMTPSEWEILISFPGSTASDSTTAVPKGKKKKSRTQTNWKRKLKLQDNSWNPSVFCADQQIFKHRLRYNLRVIELAFYSTSKRLHVLQIRQETNCQLPPGI